MLHRRIALAAAAVFAWTLTHNSVAAQPDSAPRVPSATLKRIADLNPDLAADDPRELPMKVRSLLGDEQRFFRGTADLFYSWCGRHCRDWLSESTDWIRLHGDLHVGNVGTVPAAPDGRTAFGIVDLDDTVVGPFQFDLLRAMTSVCFAARHNGKELSPEQARSAAGSMCEAYAKALRGESRPEELPECRPVLDRLFKKAAEEQLSETVRDYCRMHPALGFKPFRQSRKGRLKDVMQPVSVEERRELIEAFWRFVSTTSGWVGQSNPYDFPTELTAAVHDVVRWIRLGSAGSQGLDKYLLLVDWPVDGRSQPLIVQLKQEPEPAAARAGVLPGLEGESRAREVAESYAELQSSPLWFVGHTTAGARAFLIKTKNPWSKEPEAGDFDAPNGAETLAALLGSALGTAHRTAELRREAGAARIEAITRQADALAPELADRSLRVTAYLLTEFETLQADPQARGLAAKADAFIAGCAAEASKS